MTAALSSIPVIALSSVPGTNVFAGFIKFFVYWNKQDELKHDLINGAANAIGSMSVDKTGKKVAVVAKETLDQIESDVSNLKWFSLLQMIPLIGIIGVIFEQRILHATVNQPQNDTITVNQLQTSSEEKLAKQSAEAGGPILKGEPDLKTKNVISLTNANYKNFIGPESKGTVFVLFHGKSWNLQSKNNEEIICGLAEKRKDVTFAEVELTARDSPEVTTATGVSYIPTFKAFKDGQDLGTFEGQPTAEKIDSFIEAMLFKASTSFSIEV